MLSKYRNCVMNMADAEFSQYFFDFIPAWLDVII